MNLDFIWIVVMVVVGCIVVLGSVIRMFVLCNVDNLVEVVLWCGVFMVIVFIVVVLLYFEVDIFGELILVVMVVINVILFVLLMLCVSVLY